MKDSKPSEPASTSTETDPHPFGIGDVISARFWLATILILLLFLHITLSSMYLYWNGAMTGTHALSLILCPWAVLYAAWRLVTH